LGEEAGGFGSGELVEALVFGNGEFDVSDPGGSGLVGGDGDRAVPGGDEEVNGIGCSWGVFVGSWVLLGCRVFGDRCRAGVGGGDEGAGVTELGQGREGGVAVDAGVGAGLGLVPAEDVFGGLEGLLDGPAASGDGDQVRDGESGGVGDVADEVGQLVGARDQPADQ
jgi:hypothetical protein